MEPWELLVTSSVVAAGVSLLANRILRDFDESKLRSAHKKAIAAEIERAREFAEAYLDPRTPRAPMAAMSTTLYQQGVPRLIALRALNYECIEALLTYYNNIEQMNASLRQMIDLGAIGDLDRQQKEAGRAYMKAASLVPRATLLELLNTPEGFLGEANRRAISQKYGNYRDGTPYDRVKRTLSFV